MWVRIPPPASPGRPHGRRTILIVPVVWRSAASRHATGTAAAHGEPFDDLGEVERMNRLRNMHGEAGRECVRAVLLARVGGECRNGYRAAFFERKRANPAQQAVPVFDGHL